MMTAGLGEYAGEHAFPLPKPVSMQMRILGARCQGVETPDQIQPAERSAGSGTDGTSYIMLRGLQRLERESERECQPELERVERRMEVRVFPQLSSCPALSRGFCVPRAADLLALTNLA